MGAHYLLNKVYFSVVKTDHWGDIIIDVLGFEHIAPMSNG